MKLKSKTIIYELEDGSKFTKAFLIDKTNELIYPEHEPVAFSESTHTHNPYSKKPYKKATIWEMPTKPKKLFYLFGNGDNSLIKNYYLSKQEAIKAAEDYLKGEK